MCSRRCRRREALLMAGENAVRVSTDWTLRTSRPMAAAHRRADRRRAVGVAPDAIPDPGTLHRLRRSGRAATARADAGRAQRAVCVRREGGRTLSRRAAMVRISWGFRCSIVRVHETGKRSLVVASLTLLIAMVDAVGNSRRVWRRRHRRRRARVRHRYGRGAEPTEL